MKSDKSRIFKGFTIVELLVVIVVIGVLAAITVVSYTGISQKAVIASLESDLINASKLLKMDQIINGVYPATLAAANSGKGIPSSPGTIYRYIINNSLTPPGFCIVATKDSTDYMITNESNPLLGDCRDFGLVLALDAGDSVSYPSPFNGTIWNDISGMNNDGILVNGVGYNSINNGVLSFDGINDYVSVNSAPALASSGSLSAWVYVNSWKTSYDSIIFKGPGVSWSDIDYGLFRSIASNTFLGTINNGVKNLSGAGPTSSAIALSQWYNLVFTWDSSVAKFYTNNIQTGSVNCNFGAGTRSANMKIGSHVLGNGYFFNGFMSNIRIYNRALSVEDINLNFNSLRGRYGI